MLTIYWPSGRTNADTWQEAVASVKGKHPDAKQDISEPFLSAGRWHHDFYVERQCVAQIVDDEMHLPGDSWTMVETSVE